MPAAITGCGPSYAETMGITDVASSGASPRSIVLGSQSSLIAGHLVCPLTLSTGSDDDEQFWLHDGASSNWECRATIISGTLSTGATGSWDNCGTVNTWTKASGASVSFTLEIGRAGANTALDSCTVTL